MHFYPLLKIVILFVAGLMLGRYFSLPEPTGLYLAAIGFGGTLFFHVLKNLFPGRLTRPASFFFLGIFIILIGMLRYTAAVKIRPDDISRFISTKPGRMVGVIRGDPIFQRHGARFELQCQELERGKEKIPVTGILQVLFHGQIKEVESILRCGNRIAVSGIISLPTDRENPGELSNRKRSASKSIHALCRIYRSEDIFQLDGSGHISILCLAVKFKHHLQKIIQAGLPNPQNRPGSLQSALLEGLMLGNREGIPHEIRDKFRSVGAIHVLVVSGLHVGFIWVLGSFIFSPIPLRIRHGLLIPLVAGYVLMTGATTATVRAGLMASVYSLSFMLNRPRNALTAIAASALALLLYNPLNLFTAGFQLSFMIVISIITLTPIIDRRLHFLPTKFRPFLGVPLAAQLGALPLTAYYFHAVSLIALVANILVCFPIIWGKVWVGSSSLPIIGIDPSISIRCTLFTSSQSTQIFLNNNIINCRFSSSVKSIKRLLMELKKF